MLGVLTLSCSKWVVPRTDYLDLNQPKKRLKIEFVKEGEPYETTNYEFFSDSLLITGAKTPFYQGKPVAFALDSIAVVKAHEVDPAATVIGVVVSLSGFYLLINALSGLGSAGSGLK